MEDADMAYQEQIPSQQRKPHFSFQYLLALPLELVAGFVSLLP
jgi:hypothetical protein